MVYPYPLLMSAHNALQQALYGTQHAQLATTNHQMAPPPTKAPRYDGLIYRSSLLSYVLPAAPPPASEWSVQSKACLDILGATARKHDSTIEDPLENLTLYSVRLGRDQGLFIPCTQSVSTLSDFLDRLTVQFALIAHDGAIFSSTVLRYQYERDAYNQPDSDTPIPTQLVGSYQVLTHSISQIRDLVSHLKDSGPLYDLVGMECRQAIKDAVLYVEFYVDPYMPAITALMKSVWEVSQAAEGHSTSVSVVSGHMRWLMDQEDGEV